MTPELAERLRVLQATNAAVTGANVASILRSTWRPSDPEAAFESFVARAVPAILSGARQGNLLGRTGWVAAGGEVSTWRPREPMGDAIRESLYGTVRPILTEPERTALTVPKAQSKAMGVAVRRVTMTHQESVIDSVRGERVRTGYLLVTRANPCYFCAMLASRGPIYSDTSMDESDARFSGIGSAKVHDNCGCSLVRIGPRDLDENVWKWLEYDQLWTKVVYGSQENRDRGVQIVRGGHAQILAFRRAWEAIHPPARTARWETFSA